MKDSTLKFLDKSKKYYNKITKNKKVRNTVNTLTDTSTFKKTFMLSLFYVFLFYLPFTFMTVVLHKVVFFQLDYVYQFSTIVFDFRNKLMSFDLSTWDFKNGIGYDYFANFYYIPFDITLLPYFLFPFLSYSQLMWLTFVFKVLLGTAAFSYLLKLYKINHKTILLVSVLYGTADLFFAQNVFPSYTGLTFYIPLVLIAIELIFQRKNYLIFTLVFFQIFLFNAYWAWNLSLFMMFALFFRYLFNLDKERFQSIYHYFKKDINYFKNEFKKIAKLDHVLKKLFLYIYQYIIVFIYTLMSPFIAFYLLFKELINSVFFYLLGLGLAAFFFLPTFGVMSNEPRMEIGDTSFLHIFKEIFLNYKAKFNPFVYYKEFFKMLVPNLYMYSGYFYDNKTLFNGKIVYWLTTNHVVIYSSILASFTLFFLVLYPNFLAKDKLNKIQYKTFVTLKLVTIFATVLLFFPITANLFSMNSGYYLRWLIFYGVLLIINLAFILEYKLFNRILFALFLVVSIGYLIFSIQYNRNFLEKYRETHNGNNPNIFTGIEENVAYTMIITYFVILLMIIILDKYMRAYLALIVERIVGIGLIIAICMSPSFTQGVKHADYYGKEINSLMEEVDLPTYYTMSEFLFYNDTTDIETMQDMTYLFDFPVYNNFNIFHSLISPYFTFDTSKKNPDPAYHKRYYRGFDIPYMYYYYMDPSLFIMSNSKENPIKNGMYDPSSTLVGYKEIEELNSYLTIYQKQPQFSIGNGFTTYYDFKDSSKFNYMWLGAIYIHDETLQQMLEENGFSADNTLKSNLYERIRYTTNEVIDFDIKAYYPDEPYMRYAGEYQEFPVNVSKEEADVVVIGQSSKAVFSADNDGNIRRCYATFCFVPESGLKSIISTLSYPQLYLMNKETIEAQKEELLKYMTYDVKIDGNHISSKVNNDKPIIMTYKIGYAKGWNVYVDGKKVETFPSYNGQLSFILKETGTHEIKMDYETPYLREGIYISTGSFVVFGGLTYYYIRKRRSKKWLKTQLN